MRASAGSKGGVFLNATGGAIRFNGQVVQKSLRTAQAAEPLQRSA